MADRTNAAIFAALFQSLAQHVADVFGTDWEPDVDDDVTRMALALFALSQDFDFDTYQMFADETLARLGLAKQIADDDYEYIDCPSFTSWVDFSEVELFPPTLDHTVQRNRPQPPQTVFRLLPFDSSIDTADFIREARSLIDDGADAVVADFRQHAPNTISNDPHLRLVDNDLTNEDENEKS